MTLFMHAFEPDVARFVQLAARKKLLPPGDDLGYSWHVALSATFGAHAPKPFIWCPAGTTNGTKDGRLLCYAPHPLAALLDRAATSSDPEFAAALKLSSAASKEMPTIFEHGKRLGFRVRVRPIVRTGKARDGSGGKERDAYLSSPDQPAHDSSRGDCYLNWLGDRFATAGARLEHGSLDSFQLTRLMTRDRSGTKSRRDAPTGPDAVATGTLVVTEPEAFSALLARGVGRFRAFGFGMLLLAPASDVTR